MKALVVYDSRQGNTEKIAQTVAESLKTTMHVAVARVDKGDAVNVEAVDLVVIGCPTHQRGVTIEVEFFLRFIPNHVIRNKRVAVFDTRTEGWHWFMGSAANSLTHKLQHEGAVPVLSPESFYTSDPHGTIDHSELWRASNWARAIQQALQLLPM